IHSLDRESVAKQIEKRATKPVDCFVQVNVSGEETKHGLQPKEVLPFIKDMVAYEKVRIVGLMTMAPHVDDERVLRNTFQELAGLKEKVQRVPETYFLALVRHPHEEPLSSTRQSELSHMRPYL